MSRSLNEVRLLGHVGKDPEVKITSGGTTIANFSIATSTRYKPKDSDEWTEKTEWHNLKAFAKTADIIKEYVKKGSQLYISGRLETSSWEDKESGEKKYRTDIIVNELIMLGGKGEDAGGERRERKSTEKKADPHGTFDPHEFDGDDSIPF